MRVKQLFKACAKLRCEALKNVVEVHQLPSPHTRKEKKGIAWR
jgi:hypothetical protein